jgi:HPt (histidine-containing phosphotransfer) domain-containing protein
MSKQQERLRAGMIAIWVKGLPHVRAQLEALELLSAAVTAGNADEEMRRAGEREAHRLAGSVGSFGFQEASAKARELELMLQSAKELDAGRVADLTTALRSMLDREDLPEPPPPKPRPED